MSFQLTVNQELVIDGVSYLIAEHPAAPGMPYGQEGRQAIVYQVVAGKDRRALKVFKPRYRVPLLVSLADRLKIYAGLPGLAVCQRTVLTPEHHAGVLKTYPDLTYAVLMPWIDGPTWMEVLLEKQELSPDTYLTLARSLARVLSKMEQEGLAHCDLSGPNVLLPGLVGGTGIGLVDVEQMYGPELRRPPLLPGGSPGYAHKTAPEGLWSPEADRFAGAVLLAEMLGWSDGRVREAAWGENYFDPNEMQQTTEPYQVLVRVLQERWGDGVAGLFERAWRSETLADCATFGEWLVRLPEMIPAVKVKPTAAPPAVVPTPPPDTAEATVRTLMDRARRFEEQGQIAAALGTYRQAQTLIPAESGLAQELALIVHNLETKRQPVVEPVPPSIEEVPIPPKQVGQGDTGGADLARLFDAALTAYQRGEWPQARELLAEVVRRQPGYTRGGQQAARLLADVELQLTAPTREPARRWPLWAVLVGAFALGLIALIACLAMLTGMVTTDSHPTPTQVVSSTPYTPTATPTKFAETATPSPSPTPTTVPTSTATPSPTPTPQSRIAFVSDRTGSSEVWVMNADGSDQKQVTKIGYVESLSWSFDNQRIVFVAGREGMRQVYSVNVDGSGQQRLTSGGDCVSAQWSSDGRLSYASNRDGNWEIYVDGKRITYNDTDDYLYVWSPQEDRIAFEAYKGESRKLFVVNPDGSGLHQITGTSYKSWNVGWSPDGTQLVFASNRDSTSQIFTIKADGTGMTVLTPRDKASQEPVWSPNGQWIGFLMHKSGSTWELCLMDTDGKNLRHLASAVRGPSWAPDSQHIAFVSWDGDREIYVMDNDGSGIKRLTNNSSKDDSPVWSR